MEDGMTMVQALDIVSCHVAQDASARQDVRDAINVLGLGIDVIAQAARDGDMLSIVTALADASGIAVTDGSPEGWDRID